MQPNAILEHYKDDSLCNQLFECRDGVTALLGLLGSSVALYVAALAKKEATGAIHTLVANDKDEAGFLYYDLLNFVEADNLFFFPTGYKGSVIFGAESEAGLVQRTALLNNLKQRTKDSPTIFICTYPAALAEKLVDGKSMNEGIFSLKKGEKLSVSFISEVLGQYGFVKSDFVYKPGEFSVRGGIVDIFSYANNHPYRIDMFGDTIDSIRLFDINTQLSTEPLEAVDIVPNLRNITLSKENFVPYAQLLLTFNGANTYWIDSMQALEQGLKGIKAKLAEQTELSGEVLDRICGYKEFVESVKKERIFCLHGTSKELPAQHSITFDKVLQPSFSKNFELLLSQLVQRVKDGYKNYIVTQNKAQVERLESIFSSLGSGGHLFDNLDASLHSGFTDNDNKICLYTDHQIFERNHRYQIIGELPKAESLTIAELEQMNHGDYVVHIDHGVGKYGGLVRSEEGGKVNEAIKLIYRDGDILLVNVHSLHKISKYKDKDVELSPKLHKLGSATWQRQKLSAKSKVKDIAKDLIALYAKRKASTGFAFSPDGYMQQELEASFIYEDTPDQQKSTAAFKADMEQPVPMDRLICGDVGFGKTEIAMRAAFKAATDGKQVAVLVPTTVLSLQHYRTFTRRLKEFPVKVENLSRAKSAKETADILERLKQGKIDILIGTHKILSKGVDFKDLGLLIIDEEQKFGVSSKEKLRHLRENIDTLTLTATPIPRTLQFSLMGARDLSIINTPPPNRCPVATEVHEFSAELIGAAIEQEMARGGQVFVVHNRIDTIEHIASIIRKVAPKARLVVGHGQMPPAKLESIMTDFIYGEYDVLVATTIIESGIDIPNANTIIINNAQNFGLSDLHQLRGRVGRTNRKAYCYLLTPPIDTIADTARRRLRAIEEFSNLGAGFNIAMQDLDIRGAGNMLGAEQSGFIADIGFETYRKILQEAMMELRNEGYSSDEGSGQEQYSFEADNTRENIEYFVGDCQIDIDAEAFVPDSYVANTNEKIRLYRQIDALETEAEAEHIKFMLSDRFGELPKPVDQLLSVVVLRKMCMAMGFEKAIVKNGFFIVHFVSSPSSSYYQTELFGRIMDFVGLAGANFKLKHTPERLLLSVKGVGSTEDAIALLKQMKAHKSVNS